MTRGFRILVTGSGGFIGSTLCRALAGAGVRVTGTVRPGSTRAAPAAFRAPAPAGPHPVERFEVDLSRREDCAALVADVRPDCVFHLASLVTGKRGIEVVPGTFDANLASSVYLMEACAAVGTPRFVLAGSVEEPSDDGIARSAYAASKAAARMYATFFASSGRLDVRHARIAMVYGPGQVDRSKLVPHTVDALLAGRAPALTSGARLADWTHVDDVVDALLALAGAERLETGPPGEGVEIGTGRLSSVRDVVEALVRLDARGTLPRFGALDDRGHECDRAANVLATWRAIGWQARIDLERGLAHTWRAESGRSDAGPLAAARPARAGTPRERFASVAQTSTGSMVRATP